MNHREMWDGGKTLRGADLRGADLHGLDLRGLDLGDADLREADLSHVRTGFGWKAAFAQTVAAVVIAGVGGLTSSLLGQTIYRALQSPDAAARIGGVILAAELLLCLVTMTWRGTLYTVQRVLPSTLALLLLTSLGLILLRGSARGSGLMIVALVVLFIAMIAAVTLARAIASGVSRLALVVVLAAWLIGARGASGNVAAVLVAVATAIAGLRAVGGSSTSPLLSRWVQRIGTLGGTSFPIRGSPGREAGRCEAPVLRPPWRASRGGRLGGRARD